MRHLPKIQIERVTFRGYAAILLKFEYDVMLVNICKELGAKWSESQKSWHLEDTGTNRKRVYEAFSDRAWLEWPKKRQQLEDRKEKGAAMRAHRFTTQQLNAIKSMVRLLKSLGRSPRTITTYEQLMVQLFAFLKKQPKELTNDDVVRFQSDHLVRQGYAESTQRQFVTAMRYLLESNHLPSMDITMVRGPKKSKKLPKVLSRTEVMSILSA